MLNAESVPLSRLSPADWNPRRISDERFQNLLRSIQADPAFLWRRPVLALADGTIYAGNMRYRAAQYFGLESIPAILEDIPEQLARERALRDNAQWGEWVDDDLAALLEQLRTDGSALDLLGFEEKELRTLLAKLEPKSGLTDPDDIPEPPAEPITKPGDLWLLGPHRVLCGDATDPHDVEIVINGEQARLMATDPPYLVDYTGGNHPPSKANRPETRTLVAAAWDKVGLLQRQVIIWVKSRGVLTRSHFMWQHEPAMYGWRKGQQPELRPPANLTTVWHVDQKGEQDGIHPTQKPVELFRRPLLWHTLPDDLCFEPFLGSGTCLIAAQELGRRCYAIDQEPAYVDVAVTRWERFTGLKAELVRTDGS